VFSPFLEELVYGRHRLKIGMAGVDVGHFNFHKALHHLAGGLGTIAKELPDCLVDLVLQHRIPGEFLRNRRKCQGPFTIGDGDESG